MIINEGTLYGVFVDINKEHPELKLGNVSYDYHKVNGVRVLDVNTKHCKFSMALDRNMERVTLIQMIIARYKQALEIEAQRLETHAVFLRSIANGTSTSGR